MTEHTTKEKILVAARELFIEYGFTGTSIGKIAKQANVNHSLVFHHYKNKETLWASVKQSLVKDVANQSKMLPSLDLSFKAFLQELLLRSVSFYKNHPQIIRMINWQRLEHDIHQKIGITPSSETQAWIDAFKHYQLKGDVDPHLKPEFIMTLVLSIVSSAAMDHNTFISGPEEKPYIDFCVESLYKGLRNRTPQINIL